jgi:hypothetical protein
MERRTGAILGRPDKTVIEATQLLRVPQSESGEGVHQLKGRPHKG